MIRVYGTVMGEASMARVTAGTIEALRSLNLLAGFVPVDAYDQDEPYEGGNAEIGLLTAPPSFAWVMGAIGRHKERLSLLPPNSTWVPERLLELQAKSATGFITPSDWAEGILSPYAAKYGLPVYVWNHGVLNAFSPDKADAERLLDQYAMGSFRVLHMASTDRQRKGTGELLEAWTRLVDRDKVGARPELRLIVDDVHGALRQKFERGSSDEVRKTVKWVALRRDFSAVQAARAYRECHLVCQPSRGEGFGMVPLEALACGVPVAATIATGHTAYLETGMPGLARVRTGGLASIDDGPGAKAPSLSASDVEDSLYGAYYGWPHLQELAIDGADALRAKWSWKATTERWIDRYGLVSERNPDDPWA